MGPKVTIGVCVRNSEEFIGESIQSILTQDFPCDKIKLVFVDDGSEDRTLSIIKDYVNIMEMTVVVLHTSWKGLGNARNMVIRNVEGDYLLWVDGDMVLSKDYVTKLVEFMDHHPEVGIAKGKQTLKPGGNLLATLEAYSRAAGRMVNYRSKKAIGKSLGAGGAIYRIEAINQVGLFDENLRGYGEDQDIEIRIRVAGWLLDTVEAEFSDYERHVLTWRNLWSRYWLRGYHTHYFLNRNRGAIKHYFMFPPIAFFSGLFQSFTLYKLTCKKTIFLLPFQFVFKMTGWYAGYVRSYNKQHGARYYSS